MIGRVLLLLVALATTLPVVADNPWVWMDTDRGPILLDLDPARVAQSRPHLDSCN